ncbi:F-box protein At5g07610-like isoform X2 [Apium graveolens]
MMEEEMKQFASLCLSSKSTSAEVVISNYDLLSEILSYVPVKRLICFKSVSKQWLSLISSARFAMLHYRQCRCTSRTSAVFLESEVLLNKMDKHMVLINLNGESDQSHKNPFRYTSFSHDTFDPNKVLMLQSCHGLLLCRTGIVVTHVPRPLFHYYVYNPTTNQLATIPINWSNRVTIHASVLVFDPSKSPYYKIVFCIHSPHMCPHSRRFVIYYSQTKTWKTSALGSFIPPVYLAMFNFAYFKGSIYWITTSKVDKLVLSYNVDEDTLTTLPRPPEKVSSFIRRSFYFGESAGHLHIAEVFACAASSLDVYQLNPDHTGWFLKFKVDLYQLSKDLPQMRSNMYTYVDEYAFSILSLVRSREDFDEDSVLVLEVPGKVIVYNLVDQSWKEVHNFRRADNPRHWRWEINSAIDYNESLACVNTASFW